MICILLLLGKVLRKYIVLRLPTTVKLWYRTAHRRGGSFRNRKPNCFCCELCGEESHLCSLHSFFNQGDGNAQHQADPSALHCVRHKIKAVYLFLHKSIKVLRRREKARLFSASDIKWRYEWWCAMVLVHDSLLTVVRGKFAKAYSPLVSNRCEPIASDRSPPRGSFRNRKPNCFCCELCGEESHLCSLHSFFNQGDGNAQHQADPSALHCVRHKIKAVYLFLHKSIKSPTAAGKGPAVLSFRHKTAL